MLRQAQHDEVERHPEPVSVFASRCRRVFLSMGWDMLRQAQHDEDERHPEPVSVFASRCRRVFSSTDWGMLRQAQHDEDERHPDLESAFYEPKSKGIFEHGLGYASTGSA